MRSSAVYRDRTLSRWSSAPASFFTIVSVSDCEARVPCGLSPAEAQVSGSDEHVGGIYQLQAAFHRA